MLRYKVQGNKSTRIRFFLNLQNISKDRNTRLTERELEIMTQFLSLDEESSKHRRFAKWGKDRVIQRFNNYNQVITLSTLNNFIQSTKDKGWLQEDSDNVKYPSKEIKEFLKNTETQIMFTLQDLKKDETQ